MNELIERFEPLAASYIATIGIGMMCAYLGIFTVLRRIVFTGVALAQVAAAGVATSFFVADSAFFSGGLRSFAAQYGGTLGSLGLTILGALGFEARPARSRISTDALVGIVFAASSALSILLVWRSSRGLVELKNILAGDVLLSATEDLFMLWFGIIAVAIVHAKMRRMFLLVSFDPEFARSMRVPVHRLQLILMATLAVAIALSLRIGGLLLVFSCLVMPPICGLKIGRKLGPSTFFAMASAVAATLMGYTAAIVEDLPIAPSVAAAQLAVLLISLLAGIHGIFRFLVQGAVSVVAAAALVLVVVIFPVPELGSGGGAHGHQHSGAVEKTGPTRDELLAAGLEKLNAAEVEVRRQGAQDLGVLADSRAVEVLCRALDDDDEQTKKLVEDALRAVGQAYPAKKKLDELAGGSDIEMSILAARAMLITGNKDGIRVLIAAFDSDEVPPWILSGSVIPVLRRATGKSFGYDIEGEDEANEKALGEWRSWWKKAGSTFTLPAAD